MAAAHAERDPRRCNLVAVIAVNRHALIAVNRHAAAPAPSFHGDLARRSPCTDTRRFGAASLHGDLAQIAVNRHALIAPASLWRPRTLCPF
jgi:hypothetical protein